MSKLVSKLILGVLLLWSLPTPSAPYYLLPATYYLSENARVSLLTCSPGQELYARYGHTAIRVCDPVQNIDYVFNYGLFSFEDSHFYFHFVQGQTWYQLGVQSYSGFMYEYQCEHRQVYEQTLLLTPEEQDTIFKALMINALPENRTYLYNFVFDNCATRPYHIIQNALGNSIRSHYTDWEGATYRDFIHHFTRHGSWAEFGINLIFGYKADQAISGEQRMFLPEALMLWLQQAYRPNAAPLTQNPSASERSLLPSTFYLLPFTIEPVRWYESWYFGLAVFVCVCVCVSLYDRRRSKRSKWLDYTLYVIYALLAALLIFLIFFSVHPLVSIGWFVFIIPLIHLCTRLIYIWH